MSKINIANNDAYIIDAVGVSIALAKTMSADQDIQIVLNGEGPCARSLGLYAMLDQLCEAFNYDAHRIEIVTCNLLEQHDRYRVTRTAQTKYLYSSQRTAGKHDTKKLSNLRHFAHFVGHGNRFRLELASYLYQYHGDKTLQSYHFTKGADYHRPFVAIDELIHADVKWNRIQAAIELLKSAPLQLDIVESMPILDPVTLNIASLYPNFFLELVSVTYFSGSTFYLDEKIWRPMMMKTPFMIQGPQNYILNLRRLGFKTFDQWWDEGYSQDPCDCQVPAMIENIRRLAELDNQQLHRMLEEMQPVLDHNYERFLSLGQQDLKSLCKI